MRWCPRPDLNWYAPITEAADFKNIVSTAKRVFMRVLRHHSNLSNSLCNEKAPISFVFISVSIIANF